MTYKLQGTAAKLQTEFGKLCSKAEVSEYFGIQILFEKLRPNTSIRIHIWVIFSSRIIFVFVFG